MNTAPYGKDISGFPFSVRVIRYDNSTAIASGQLYPGTIEAELIDPEG
jgi:hypothetical protein